MDPLAQTCTVSINSSIPQNFKRTRFRKKYIDQGKKKPTLNRVLNGCRISFKQKQQKFKIQLQSISIPFLTSIIPGQMEKPKMPDRASILENCVRFYKLIRWINSRRSR
eukprot:Pompholyxophrys_punicea_v1_NODE_1012_length_1043_cov_3.427126.p3 type:complete len:109 gc:universal NODE_1012_length_1043_cov_3.427126:519-845(+)